MILVVDDHENIGAVLACLLRSAGREAVHVPGGAEALAMLHSRTFSLVVLDIHMPEMDGLTVLKTIKEDDALKHVPIAMYSADASYQNKSEALRLGAVAFLVKGTIDFDKLIARICELSDEAA